MKKINRATRRRRKPVARKRMRAFYEAATPSRTFEPKRDRRSGNAQTALAAMPLRNTARHLDENYDVASGILDTLVTNSVGKGISPEPQVMLSNGEPATEVNTKFLRLWDQWIFACDVTGQLHYYPQQRLKARSWFRDGEVFTQRILGNVPGLQHGTVLPYSLEALEADFVPHDYSDAAARITQGIEVNAWGRPVAYHCYKSHPGDTLFVSLNGIGTKRVPARVMTHLKFVKRLHQLRGISVFAPSLKRLDDIKGSDDDERIAARVAASMAAYIKKGNPDTYEGEDDPTTGQPRARREMYFEPGIIFDELRPGEDVGTIDTKRPNNALIPFRQEQFRSAAAGTMTAASSISKYYEGSYSSKRQELVEAWAIYQILTSEFVYADAQPTYDGFVDAILLSGAVDLPTDVDRSTLYDCTHSGPSMIWIDPENEAQALVLQMQWGLKSRTRIIRERGDTPDQVNREIQRDQQERERLGLRIGERRDSTAASDKRPGESRQAARIRKQTRHSPTLNRV